MGIKNQIIPVQNTVFFSKTREVCPLARFARLPPFLGEVYFLSGVTFLGSVRFLGRVTFLGGVFFSGGVIFLGGGCSSDGGNNFNI